MSSVMKVDSITKSDGTAGVHIAGHVIQVINCKSSGRLETNNSTYVDVPGMSITITPKFANSGIIGFYENHVYIATGSQTWQGVEFRVLRDSTVVTVVTGGGNNGYGTAHAGSTNNPDRMMEYATQSFDDYNHNSTSAITYKVQVANTNGSTGTHDVNQPSYGQGGRMTIMEIAQ